MNTYSDNIYSDILEDDAVYNNQQWAQKKVKNARRSQRKQKQAQRNARYDSYWTVHQTTNAAYNAVY